LLRETREGSRGKKIRVMGRRRTFGKPVGQGDFHGTVITDRKKEKENIA